MGSADEPVIKQPTSILEPSANQSAQLASAGVVSGRSVTPLPSKPRVLIVDDDATVLRSTGRIVRALGYEVVTADNGAEAVEIIKAGAVDAVLSDIAMPGMTGIDLLRMVRRHDLLVPVVLITGEPAVSTAVQALELGALHYLTKPIGPEELTAIVEKAIRLHRVAKLKQQAAVLLGNDAGQAADRAGLEASFERCLSTLWVAYHPIVAAPARRIFAFEALMRSKEPSLPHPGAVIDAAVRLDTLDTLGRTIRARVAGELVQAPADARIFVNLHVTDLMDPSLSSPDSPLSQHAHRVVLEMTERASLDAVKDVRARIADLRALGYQIAVDDLGAGYAGLSSFALLEPEFVKLDMSLVRGLDTSSTKQRVIRSMTSLSHEMGISVVAEGVETIEEAKVLIDLECDYLQGFLYARPSYPFPDPKWPDP